MRRRSTLTAAVITVGAHGLAVAADASLFSSASMPEMRPTWQWVTGAAIVGLILGFVTGWRVLAWRIRKKYGGLKIY